MDEVAEEREKWKAYFLPKAESGDPDAQLAVGTDFANGKCLSKDLGQ
ncbi:hypothetical protein NKI54_33075 [Mesorhizobium sp. M0663]